MCKAETELLHRKYQEAFNAGDLDRLIKVGPFWDTVALIAQPDDQSKAFLSVV